MLGDPRAPVVIAMMSDFGCPHCARAWGELEDYVDGHRDVQVRILAFPLSDACNVGSGDPERCTAAAAAMCASQQGRLREAADALFANPIALDPVGLPDRAGLDASRFARCLADPATDAAVRADAAEGRRVGVEGVPTLWVGRLGEQPERIEGSVDEVLAAAERAAGR